MNCKSKIKPPGFDFYVDCGQCMPCRIRRKAEWATRLWYESEEWDNSSFLTLTFDNEHLPKNNSLLKETMPLFNKRLRMALSKEGRNIKFMYNGEYGSTYNRAHHHGIYFGIDPIIDQDLIHDTWGQGKTEVTEATEDRMSYVAGYIIDKITGDLSEEYYGGRLPPFARMSQGIGLNHAKKIREQLLEQGLVTRKGIKYKVPEYFKRKLELDVSDGKLIAKEIRQEYDEYYKKKGWSYYDKQAVQHRKDEAMQVKINILAKSDQIKSKRGQNDRAM